MKSKKLFKSLEKKTIGLFQTEEVLKESEYEANRLVALTMLYFAILIFVIMLVNMSGVFDLDQHFLNLAALVCISELIVCVIVCRIFKGERKWMKYFLMLIFIFVLAQIDMFFTYTVTIIMVLPVIISARYYSRKYTAEIAVLTGIEFAFSAYQGASKGLMDLNYIDLYPGTAIDFGDGTTMDAMIRDFIDMDAHVNEIMLHCFLPKAIFYFLIVLVCYSIAGRGYDMVVEQAEISSNTARIATELGIATEIQSNLLPSIFPPYPDRTDMDVFASMDPAKEVGGDFYDFFLIDRDHIAIVIADVAGKGVPAALFMVTAKTLIKDHASMGLSPGETFEKVNNILCEGNDLGMFVTAWMAIVDLKTGEVSYTNAGHNPPLIRCGNGDFKYLKGKPNLVLACFENVKYQTEKFFMGPCDKIYLYTDGVTEAVNEAGEQYGEERLLNMININKQKDISETCKEIRRDLDIFKGNAEQADDITMLAFYYKGDRKMFNEFQTEAVIEKIPEVTAFVDEKLEALDCPPRAQMQIDIAIDELFSNIAHYAYDPEVGPATVRVEIIEDPLSVILTFIDHGKPFNPLESEDPDVTKNAEERSLGGLGIFMVKQTMDDVLYEYKDGQNILTIKKNLN